jgi:hypothetical protein
MNKRWQLANLGGIGFENNIDYICASCRWYLPSLCCVKMIGVIESCFSFSCSKHFSSLAVHILLTIDVTIKNMLMVSHLVFYF